MVSLICGLEQIPGISEIKVILVFTHLKKDKYLKIKMRQTYDIISEGLIEKVVNF